MIISFGDHNNVIMQPTLIIPLKNLTLPYDITKIFQSVTPLIEKYIYEFRVGNVILKYGISRNNDGDGERVYRQAAHIPGWPSGLAKSDYGKDMEDVVKEYNEIYNTFLNKDDVILTVWNMEDISDIELRRHEAELILEHVKNIGKCPIGNKEDYTKNLKSYVPKKHFDAFFEEVS